ncbi:hypothetical protein FAI41_05740 [Acetobacteraceae bacterium]|nr:hypothetical protein FAI41_05740 [Acetobacteraceae bacterium]
MNKFLLASISMIASSGAFFAGSSYAADSAQPTAQQAEADHNAPKFLGKTRIALAPGPVRLGKDGKPLQADSKTNDQQKQDVKADNEPKFLGRTGVVLAPGPVRLDKNGKPLQTPVRIDPKVRHQQDLQMKSDLKLLADGKKPETNQQRALARMTPHDRSLLLNRVNEAISAYKG